MWCKGCDVGLIPQTRLSLRIKHMSSKMSSLYFGITGVGHVGGCVVHISLLL